MRIFWRSSAALSSCRTHYRKAPKGYNSIDDDDDDYRITVRLFLSARFATALFFGVCKLLGTIFDRFLIIYFRGLGLRIVVIVLVMVIIGVIVWVRVGGMVRAGISVVLLSG